MLYAHLQQTILERFDWSETSLGQYVFHARLISKRAVVSLVLTTKNLLCYQSNQESGTYDRCVRLCTPLIICACAHIAFNLALNWNHFEFVYQLG